MGGWRRFYRWGRRWRRWLRGLYPHGHSRIGPALAMKLLKVTGLILAIVGFGPPTWDFYVQMHYAAAMPREPDAGTARVYPFTAARSLVYVTQEEADRGRLATLLGPFGVIAVALGLGLAHWA